MTWYGRQTALPCRSIEEFKTYLNSLRGGWKPSGMVLHNTASPTLQQWWHGGTTPEQRMKNLRNYYENDMGWSSGPHAFVDGVTIWIFVDFNVKGVHSPSWNGTKLGIEMVGDYSKESDESGMGKQVMDLTVALFGETHAFHGWDPDTIKLHKEDPATTHDCPGRNVVKSEFIDDVTEYMGSGGSDTDPLPPVPRTGVVANLVAGDTLNIRASSSSSAPVIGTAENGDVVSVVNEAWNGTTKWLRIQFGDAASTGVAVYGWMSAAYVDVEETPPPTVAGNHTDIEATVFGGSDDPNNSAYPPYGLLHGDTEDFVALPYSFPTDAPLPNVRVFCGELSAVGRIADKGPWTTDDAAYVTGNQRPIAETCYKTGRPLPSGPNAGRVPTNAAGIDLSPHLAGRVGISGKGKVSWVIEP